MQREKLRKWYEDMLIICKQQGTVDDYGSMLDYYRNITSVRQALLPLSPARVCDRLDLATTIARGLHSMFELG